MLPQAQLFIDRVRSGLADGVDLTHLSRWLEVNTRSPQNKFEHWSFSDHEFQYEIINDGANEQVCIKCAQIGVSEIYARLALGLVSILPAATGIYTLPTASFATRFAKQRLDTIIENSPILKGRIDSETNNTSLKRIGDGFLYISGTFTKSAAISVPAHFLIHDETDFSDAETLASFDSRLGHRKEEDIIRRWFSTPTVPGYGVDALYRESDQKTRAVKCSHCESWQTPKFADHVVIPGFERDLVDFSKEDLDDPKVRISEAYLACPGCGAPLTTENLADPARREWVPAFPGQKRSGFHCQPFDVPTINPVPRVLRSIKSYEASVADWWNFKVGVAFEDSTTSFTEEAVKASFIVPPVQPGPNAAHGCVIGVDTGKTCWITVAQPQGVSSAYVDLDILHVERLRVEESRDLAERVKQLAEWYGAMLVVVDAGPEWSQALAIKEALPPSKGYACYYVKKARTPLSNMDINEDDQVVNVARTDIIGMVAKSFNAGRIRYPRATPEKDTVISHLRALKKLKLPGNRDGDVNEVWISTGADHFGHSLIYTSIAAILTKSALGLRVIPGLPLAAKAKANHPDTGDFYSGRTVRAA